MAETKAIYVNDVPKDMHLEVMVRCMSRGTTASAVGRSLFRAWLTGKLDDIVEIEPDPRSKNGGERTWNS
jgi:hypothetical protein